MNSHHSQLYQLAILQLQQQYQQSKQACLMLRIAGLYKNLAMLETSVEHKQWWSSSQSYWLDKYQREHKRTPATLRLAKQSIQ